MCIAGFQLLEPKQPVNATCVHLMPSIKKYVASSSVVVLAAKHVAPKATSVALVGCYAYSQFPWQPLLASASVLSNT